MKLNKYTSALVGMGVVSLAGVAQANTTVYLTGSTAARAIIFNACTHAGEVFTVLGGVGGTGIASGAGFNTNGANQIVYEGTIPNVGVVDLNCSFTGSEAGIATVAGQNLKQTLIIQPAGPFSIPGLVPATASATTGTYVLPGVGTQATFLVGPAYTAAAALPVGTTPDLTMADTSQAVSQTPKALFPLTDYGIVGVVPFTPCKGYNSAPDASWTDLVDVTTAALNLNIGGKIIAKYYTGVSTDGDDVVITGRNIGSGTRANTLLNGANYPNVNASVDQFCIDANYGANTGVLTFGGNYAAGQNIQNCFGDGYDSGSKVQATLNVDTHGSVDGAGHPVVVVGYLGVSDCQNAVNPAKFGGAGQPPAGHEATPLPYNGVYESDFTVENGNFPWWGSEHLLGAIGQVVGVGAKGITGSAIVTGIGADLTRIAAGNNAQNGGPNTGNISTAAGALNCSILIPTTSMGVTRHKGDSGFPAQGAF